ncbi:hypothetical protein KAM622c_43840 [Klebsiella quasipneumoniae subsp. quasipneumoniae]|nr:hypothetical protein KAM622c_43840 [Klebsiella quasipneumoniae subsp. quasipneumoniae]
MGFDYSLVNPVGMNFKNTLDNAKERTRYCLVHPAGAMCRERAVNSTCRNRKAS